MKLGYSLPHVCKFLESWELEWCSSDATMAAHLEESAEKGGGWQCSTDRLTVFCYRCKFVLVNGFVSDGEGFGDLTRIVAGVVKYSMREGRDGL